MLNAARWAAALTAAALFILMLGPFQGAERDFGLSDKQAHAIGFAIITAALLLIFRNQPRWRIALLAFLLGGLVEAIQASNGRSASLLDLGADLLGIVAVSVLWPRRA